MKRLTLADVLEALCDVRPDWALWPIPETVIDSCQASAGCMFVALPGENVDGHDYVQHAFEKGAAIAIIEHPLPGLNYLDLRSDCHDVTLGQVDAPVCLLVENSLLALQKIASFWRRQINLHVIGITGSVGKSTTKEIVYSVLSQRFLTLKIRAILTTRSDCHSHYWASTAIINVRFWRWVFTCLVKSLYFAI